VRILCLDLGSDRVGVAVSDEDGVLASPVTTLRRRGGVADLDAIDQLCQKLGAKAIVLGLPLQLSGAEGPASQRVRRFGSKLESYLGFPVDYFDERFSTVEAQRNLRASSAKRGSRARNIDQQAAVLILQGYLDRLRANDRAPNC